eukprot:TRINITY_DN25462_c0_g1_i1.p1 TRINITY_DN25462_c0_g1~~TRINITY_DN25462_c0_g1_i1.p1  ORF type:complete len:129 (-),score=6.30 TRINITY_DN25462_c0_g1_i1:1-387(-)
MSVEFSNLCMCTQWYDSHNNFLYSTASPNSRVNWSINEDPTSYCASQCKPFLRASSSSSDSWYDNTGVLIAVILVPIIILAAIMLILYRRRKSQPTPLDNRLLPSDVGDDESYSTIGIRGTVQTNQYE